ncbi:hypothetical protein WR25_06659 [Diploscapter pachys]|uniref:Uncharacterized protein n=1 Tax=Diploscapter pachys TaxID=2018661 RepID=A0A2A2K0U7_9BILA|nr:hypothetical protein WR25_06659 [Diploscapter pachys]
MPKLRKPADRARAVDCAGHGTRVARNDMQQRRLARSVASDQADALGADRQGQVIEKRSAVRRGGGEMREGEETRHRHRGGRKGQGGRR